MRAITDLERDRLRAGGCPNCGHTSMIPGPRGGLSKNWYCENCHSAWNFGHANVHYRLRDVVFMEAIDWPSDDILDLYREETCPRPSTDPTASTA
jgi:ribosomal protein L37AE/L43A